MLVSGSFLNQEPKKTIEKFDKSNIDYVHVDIADGKFVSEKSYTISEVIKYSSYTNKPLDIHLMVSNPVKYIDELSILNVAYMTFHFEAVKNHKEIIEHIKNNGIRAGISIKPETSVLKIFPLLPYLDMVLIMSINPGKSGQKFIESVLYKIEVLRREIDEKGYKTIISIDGGINEESFPKVKEKGVDMVVCTSYLLDGDIESKVRFLKNKY